MMAIRLSADASGTQALPLHEVRVVPKRSNLRGDIGTNLCVAAVSIAAGTIDS
jgi:hypothetical protein